MTQPAERILEVRRMMPEQPKDSPFELPSEQLLRQQAVTAGETAPKQETTAQAQPSSSHK